MPQELRTRDVKLQTGNAHVGNVPDYFQNEDEDSLRQQVAWLESHLGCDDGFFARLLRITKEDLTAWRESSASLNAENQASLAHFWRAILHMLSFLNFDEQRLTRLLDDAPKTVAAERPLAPPWGGSSMKKYLEAEGPKAIETVDRWIMSFRFGNPYARA